MSPTEIQTLLYRCALRAGNSQDKKRHLIDLPCLISRLAAEIADLSYQPGGFTVFAVRDPKLREIFAPNFRDRLAQHALIAMIEPHLDRRFIDDCFANRRGKGTHAAISRLQTFLRNPEYRWYAQVDIRSFFPSIDRQRLLAQWRKIKTHLPYDAATQRQLNHLAHAILGQNPLHPPPVFSGDRRLLAEIPRHKSLFHAPAGRGLPIGALSSQFFSNIYLNGLDHYIKHTLKIRAYLRYVDDLVLLGNNPDTLQQQTVAINQYLQQHLNLTLHPQKTKIQRTTQGVDFLGAVSFPDHQFTRQRIVRALHARIDFFQQLLAGKPQPRNLPPRGAWVRRLRQSPRPAMTDQAGEASNAVLRLILATLNSYYGQFKHADTYRLRKHIYHRRLGSLQRYFLPSGPDYAHLVIRPHWLLRSLPLFYPNPEGSV